MFGSISHAVLGLRYPTPDGPPLPTIISTTPPPLYNNVTTTPPIFTTIVSTTTPLFHNHCLHHNPSSPQPSSPPHSSTTSLSLHNHRHRPTPATPQLSPPPPPQPDLSSRQIVEECLSITQFGKCSDSHVIRRANWHRETRGDIPTRELLQLGSEGGGEWQMVLKE